jgi:hypothetical protein
VIAQPALLAQHFTEAGLTAKAVGYWLKAGQQAVARSAMTEAVVQLERGLDLLGTLADSPWRQQQELDLRIALGGALMATKGFAAAGVEETFLQAQGVAEQLDRPHYVGWLLYGKQVLHLVRSEHRLALSCTQLMEQIGERQNNSATLLSGRFFQGIVRYYLGEFIAARTLFEQCHGLGDSDYRKVHAVMHALDSFSVMLAYLAQTLAYLGHIDQARSQVSQALSEARRLGHAHTLAAVLTYACRVEWAVGLPHHAQAYAGEVVALSKGQVFLYSWGTDISTRGGRWVR